MFFDLVLFFLQLVEILNGFDFRNPTIFFLNSKSVKIKINKIFKKIELF